MIGNYQIVEEKNLVVCAWCFPGALIFDARPELRRRFAPADLSHGICAPCLAKFKADLSAAKFSDAANTAPTSAAVLQLEKSSVI
jgi:hypothetical protein